MFWAWALVVATAAPTDDDRDPLPDAADVDEDVEVVEVDSPTPAPAPCGTLLDRVAVGTQPAHRPLDLLGTAPGLLVTGHLGRGRPRDLSWRGFDAAHGRDLAVSLDGVPLNEAGHVLGDGTVDMAFLPRSLVESVSLCPGGARGAVGPWATAGSAAFRFGLPEEGWRAHIESGTDGSGMITVGFRPQGWSARTFAVFEAEDGRGVGDERSWRDLRLAGGIETDLDDVHLVAWLALHDGAADVPPKLRQDDLADGVVPLRGSYRLWGGRLNERRLLLSTQVSRPFTWGGVSVRGWFGVTGTRVRDNLTGFLVDPDRGDGTDTTQSGLQAGVRTEVQGRVRTGPVAWDLSAGAFLRSWTQRQRQWGYGIDGSRGAQERDARLSHTGAGGWARARLEALGVLHLEPAIRLDHVTARATDLAADDTTVRHAFAPTPSVTLVAQAGQAASIHTAWARAIRPPDPSGLDRGLARFVRHDTVDVGIDIHPAVPVRLRLGGFVTWSPDEPILDLLDDTVLDRGKTRRAGAQARLEVRPVPRILVTIDGSLVDARLLGSGRLPYAATGGFAVGAHAEDQPLGPIRLSAGVRLAFTPPRPLPQGFATGTIAALDLMGRVSWKRWRFDLGLDNLAPWGWRSGSFVYASRWDRDARVDPLPMVHDVAGRPFAVRLGVGVRFP